MNEFFQSKSPQGQQEVDISKFYKDYVDKPPPPDEEEIKKNAKSLKNIMKKRI